MPLVELLLLTGILLIFLGLGLWIPFALGTAAILFPFLLGTPLNLDALADVAWNNTNSFVLTAVPLFVLMGALIVNSGISGRFYDALAPLVERIPGGLLHGNILLAGLLSAVTGSSVATAGAVGTAAIPEMKKRGYSLRLVYGSVTGGGMLGILIPPSIIMIIYASVAQQSVVDMFLAGVLPGITLLICFLVYVGVRVGLRPSLAPPKLSPTQRASTGKLLLSATSSLLPITALIAVVLGSIYAGYSTATEAGALGAVGALLIAMAYRGLSAGSLLRALRATLEVTCMILFIVVAAAIYSYAIVSTGLSRGFVATVISLELSPYLLLTAIAIIFLVLGMFIDGVSIIFLTLPLLMPVVAVADINLIVFGVFVVLLVEIGQITPPLGINNIVVQGIDTGARLSEVVKGSLPFGVITLGLAVIVIAFPWLATGLV